MHFTTVQVRRDHQAALLALAKAKRRSLRSLVAEVVDDYLPGARATANMDLDLAHSRLQKLVTVARKLTQLPPGQELTANYLVGGDLDADYVNELLANAEGELKRTKVAEWIRDAQASFERAWALIDQHS